MPDEKKFEDLTQEELRAAISQYGQGLQGPANPQPDAPGCAGLAQELRDTASTRYGQAIMQKRAEQVTATEREFLRAGIACALKDL
jgi:hypothetical protein